jgi:hypothetical protein
MKIKPYYEKLESSQEYKDFKTKYPDSFLVAGFFVLDLDSGANVHQIDFYIPKEKKVAAFTLDKGVTLQILDMISKDGKVPEALDIETNVDLDALQGILSDEMHNRGISEEIKKIIAVVQNIEGKKIWNLNCVLTGMEILKSHIDDGSKTVLKLEKTSIIDIMKHIPKGMVGPPANVDEKEKQLEQIEKLEKQLAKEKEKLTKDSSKKDSAKK